MSKTAESVSIFQQHACCVIIPTYNNAKTLAAVIEGCKQYCADVWVINDGSTDGTRALLETIPGITVLHQPENRGKGTALRRAFHEAGERGFAYAVTIDSDGQHDPEDLWVFAQALQQEPGPVYIGARNMGQQTIPGKSKFGHKNSNFWFWVETGSKAEDTQSGYRLYPLKTVNSIRLLTWRYEFEIEVIVRAAWKDVPVKFVPVRVYYPEDRVSHFRPFRDFLRVTLLNIWLVFAAFLWFRPLLYLRRLRKKTFRQIWREYILQPGVPAWRKGLSAGIGVFCGIVPVWGLQTALAITLAVIFRLHKPLTVLASNISIPPMIPVVVYASLGMGTVLLEGKWAVTMPEQFTRAALMADMYRYVSGSIALAIVAGLLFGLLTWMLALLFSRKKTGTAG